ncbi:3-phosphoglycerate dehydrogenase [Leptotrichia sp. OH3620_COT-345]|nr:3-phosphoglycerate dehydrogenase [Leptotrichia sp. OH3620_COT-345]
MSEKMKIVFLDRKTAGPIELKEKFSKYGEYIEYEDTDENLLEERIKDVEVIITNRIRLRKGNFEKAPKLKLILVTATGYNHIDIKAANEIGIIVANVSDYSTDSVTQLTFTFLLNEFTPVSYYNDEVKKNNWGNYKIPEYQLYPVNDVDGKVMGIVGYGNIGKKVEEIAKIFGMKTMIAKIPGRKYEIESNRYELDEVLEKCDVLSLHAPLTDLTRGLINLERMKKMKKSSIIINLARGPIINEEDLYYALKNKIIKSAAIDVMSIEPPKENSKLFELDNILITPHIGWKSEKSMNKLIDIVENNLKLFLENRLSGIQE